MFEFISSLGEEISSRYQTLIRDIKSKSSSFYDAYLDLQEASIKAIIDLYAIKYDETRTCGYLLRNEEIKRLFIDTLKVPQDIYETIGDRTLKVNRHKHRKQGHLTLDSIIAFMKTYHKFMSICCKSNESFESDYFHSIFGEYEMVNKALRQERDDIVSELEELAKEKRLTDEQLRQYKEALAENESDKDELTEQNEALLQGISLLKSLKLSVLDQKLNRTIDMLNDLQQYVVESRAVSIAAGYAITGKDDFESRVETVKAEMKDSLSQSQAEPKNKR